MAALYNMAIKDRGLADGIARAVASFDPSLLLFGLPGTELLRAGEPPVCRWRRRGSPIGITRRTGR